MPNWVKTLITTLIVAAAIFAIALYCGGCKSLYENGGSAGKAGSITAPIELSDATDSFTMRLLYSMEGATWYTRRDSSVKAKYHNCYTNTYIGCIEKVGNQVFEIEIEPLADPLTNCVEAASAEAK